MRLCNEIDNIAGRVFGLWTVVKKLPIRKQVSPWNKGHLYWECKCKCGTISYVATCALKAGNSLGCKRCKDKRLQRSAHRCLWSIIVSGAKQRSLILNVTFEEVFTLLEKQNYKCALSGLPISIASSVVGHRRNETTASLDRINNNQGYISGNLQWVHKDINFMKQDFENNQFIAYCKAVAKCSVQAPALKNKD